MTTEERRQYDDDETAVSDVETTSEAVVSRAIIISSQLVSCATVSSSRDLAATLISRDYCSSLNNDVQNSLVCCSSVCMSWITSSTR